METLRFAQPSRRGLVGSAPRNAYGKAANVTGQPFLQYRCGTAGPVISAINLVANINALFSPRAGFKQSPGVKADEWTGLFDGGVTLPGDYLVGVSGTYFIAAQKPLLPYTCVICSRVISVHRPSAVTTVGVSGYGGNTASTETPLMTGWPASILQGTKGERGDVSVPDDVKSPWYACRLAAVAGVTINSGDIVIDGLARRYTVSSAEKTGFGWRLTVRQNLN